MSDGNTPTAVFCRRCHGTAMFRPKHRDIQTPVWMCAQCDDPSRYTEIERKTFPTSRAEMLAVLIANIRGL
jgi:hypothetical protein